MSKETYILKIEETVKVLKSLKQAASANNYVIGDSKVGLSMSVRVETDINKCSCADFIMTSTTEPMYFTKQYATIAKNKFSKMYSGTLSVFTMSAWLELRINNFENILAQMKGSINA